VSKANYVPEPLVTIVTPVYNGGPYLDECISSVIKQTYQHWEYVLVDNCSTDETASIAARYAALDPRIRVVTNTTFATVIENHNIAFTHVSLDAKYCKVVAADDWLYPECLSKLVSVAEAHPSASVIGSYAINGTEVHRMGVPLTESCMSGRQICRLYLLGKYTFGAPSTALYRADLVRTTKPFYPGTLPNADTSAHLSLLRHSDFGFVHQILSFERTHEGAITSQLTAVNSALMDRFEFLATYGADYLSAPEQEGRLKELLHEYYEYLAVSIVNGERGKAFWKYQTDRLAQIGLTLNRTRLVQATIAKILSLVLNPHQFVEKIFRRMKSRRSAQTENAQPIQTYPKPQ
jgi:glycosyltransferase involved in cell wall biosynthesis